MLNQVLKKAQRDTGQSHRDVYEHFKNHLKTNIEDAFRSVFHIFYRYKLKPVCLQFYTLKKMPKIHILQMLQTTFPKQPFCIPAYNGLTIGIVVFSSNRATGKV